MYVNKQAVMLEEPPLPQPPSLDRIVVADKRLLFSEVRGEAVILNVHSGIYYGLDEIGSRIWQLVQEPTTLKIVLETLLSEYEVEPNRCERDLLEYIDLLSSKGLVHL